MLSVLLKKTAVLESELKRHQKNDELLKKLKREGEEKDAQLLDQSEEIVSLRRSAKEKDEQIGALQNQLERALHRPAVSEVAVDTADLEGRWLSSGEAEAWEQLKDALKRRMRDAEAEAERAGERVEATRSKLLQLEQRVTELDQSRRREREAVIELEGQLAKHKKDRESSLSQVERLEATNTQLAEKIAELERLYEKTKPRRCVQAFTQTMASTIVLTRQEWDDIQDQISLLQSRAASLEIQLDRREEREARLQEIIADREAAIVARNGQLGQLRSNMTSLHEKLRSLELNAMKSAVRATSSEKAEMELKKQLAELQHSVVSSSAAVKKAKASISQTSSTAEGEKHARLLLESKCRGLERALEERERELVIAKQKAELYKSYVKGANEGDMSRLRKAYDNIVAKMKEKLEAQGSDIERLEQTLLQREMETTTLKQMVASTKTEIKGKDTRIARLEKMKRSNHQGRSPRLARIVSGRSY